MSGFRILGELCTVITKGTTPSATLGGFSEAGVNYVKSESLSYSGGLDEKNSPTFQRKRIRNSSDPCCTSVIF